MPDKRLWTPAGHELIIEPFSLGVIRKSDIDSLILSQYYGMCFETFIDLKRSITQSGMSCVIDFHK